MPRHPETLITPNTLLSAARERLPSPRRPGQRISRSELADGVNAALDLLYPHRNLTAHYVDARWIGKLERGEHRWPSAERRAALRHVVHVATDAELGLYSPRRTNYPQAGTDHERGAVAGNGLAPVLPAVPRTSVAPELDGDEAALAIQQRIHRLNRTIDPDVISQHDELTNDIVSRYERLDHAEILPILVRQRAALDSLLTDCNRSAQRMQLLHIAAGTSGVLGYLAVGRARFALARAYCAEAFALAGHAAQPSLQAWARALQSFCEYYASDYPQALRLAQDGLAYAGTGPQSVRLTINGVARALGKLGDTDGVHCAVDTAHDLLARHDAPGGMPSSVSFGCYSKAQTAGNAATAYVSLGMADHAETFIDLAMPDVTRSGSPWSRSLVMLDHAAALAASKNGDLDRASRLAVDALTVSAGRPIIAVRQRTMDFIQRAATHWGDTTQVRAVRDAATSTMPAP
ncbi:hypothetical protein ACFPIJ_29210 [Dactylosporangium cerinum]|uniref:Transcriptional regulator n=1 Tax=Dactylosporangium cerinum TaxID=1434730 RepID=A0ABV9W021_9ACTN